MAFVNDNKDNILKTIDGWNGKLTYDLLLVKLQQDLGLTRKPSRHTLLNHPEVKHAFDLKKESLRNTRAEAIDEAKSFAEQPNKLSEILSNFNDDDATIAALAERAEKLESENERLHAKIIRVEALNKDMYERFARWQYNIQKMDNVDLNRLMGTIDN
jgi:predicted nuclease with TOPRIM domain